MGLFFEWVFKMQYPLWVFSQQYKFFTTALSFGYNCNLHILGYEVVEI